MKQITTLTTGRLNSARAILILSATSLLLTYQAHSQSKLRTYANYQAIYETGFGALGSSIAGNVSSASSSINLNALTASTLSVPLGALNLFSATQYLEFTTGGTHATRRTIPAGTPVIIKLSIPQELLGLLSGISIGSFTGLTTKTESWPFLAGTGNNAGASSSAMTSYYSGTTLLNVLNGMGDAEITIIPTADYNGIYLKLSSLLSLGLSANLYHAYILENGTYSMDFNKRIDVLAGAREGLAIGGIASATGSVSSPGNTIDADVNGTYSLMSTGVEVLSEVFQQVAFERPSIGGDSVSVIIQDPGAGLLDLTALNGFSIQPYLNQTAVGLPLTQSSSLLSLELLTGPGKIYQLKAPVAEPFNRVEIKMGGAANALSNLRIYDVSRITNVFTLPVTMTSLNASGKINKVEVKWNTENESDILHYSVQKSTDGRSFKTIGVVFPGENIRNSYSFPDANPVTGFNYYRVNITNKDGSSKLSGIVSVRFGVLAGTLQVAPNPVKDLIRLKLLGMEEGNYRLELYNISGQLMNSKMIRINQNEQVETMDRDKAGQPGLYWLGIYDKNNQQINTIKIFAE